MSISVIAKRPDGSRLAVIDDDWTKAFVYNMEKRFRTPLAEAHSFLLRGYWEETNRGNAEEGFKLPRLES